MSRWFVGEGGGTGQWKGEGENLYGADEISNTPAEEKEREVVGGGGRGVEVVVGVLHWEGGGCRGIWVLLEEGGGGVMIMKEGVVLWELW